MARGVSHAVRSSRQCKHCNKLQATALCSSCVATHQLVDVASWAWTSQTATSRRSSCAAQGCCKRSATTAAVTAASWVRRIALARSRVGWELGCCRHCNA